MLLEKTMQRGEELKYRVWDCDFGILTENVDSDSKRVLVIQTQSFGRSRLRVSTVVHFSYTPGIRAPGIMRKKS